MIRCDNEVCVYNKKCICILKNIEVDSMGICMSCINASIPEEVVKMYKAKTIKSLAKYL